MGNALVVHVDDGRDELLDNVHCLLLRVIPLVEDLLEEFFTLRRFSPLALASPIFTA